MARSWLRLVLAVATASAVSANSFAVPSASAQTVPKAAAKKKGAKPAEPTQDGEQPAETKKRQDPVEAQKTIEASLKQIEAGKPDLAVNALTATITAGNLPPGLLARALYYRGMAQRQIQRPGQAIADLTQALWIKGGLGESDRAAALTQRSGAYADAGLADQPLVVASAQPAKPESSSASTGSSWNPFSGFGNGFTLFSSGGQSPPPQTAPPPPPVASAPVAAPPATSGTPSVSSWSSSTEVRATPAAMASEPPAETASAPPAPRHEGKFKVQIGLVRTDGEAQAIEARVRGDLAPVFEAREPVVDQTVLGNFGAMYRVRVGPYATAGAGQAVCARLKGSGLDCLVVTQ